ncbi:MAG: hypothetical protein ACM4AI_19545 [Acidobacteriota bacterium]
MMRDDVHEKGQEKFVRSIGEDAETIRKGLSDRRVQDAFIAAIDEDPQLIEVLAKVTPNLGNVAADWSCCRGNRVQLDLEEIAESMKRRLQSGEGTSGV